MLVKQYTKESCKNPGLVAELLRSLLATEEEADQEKEHFWVIGLDVRNRVKFVDLTALGILDQVTIHPREVFRVAISQGVSSIIIGHNHPSGSMEPSRADHKVTETIYEAGKILTIPLLDHVILGEGNQFYSYRENFNIIVEERRS